MRILNITFNGCPSALQFLVPWIIEETLLLSMLVHILASSAKQQRELLYGLSRYSAPIHWLVHGHMTSNNETASRQMP